MGTKSEQEQQRKITIKIVRKNDTAKYANITSKIFHYIYTTKCRHLFSLALYNDITYASPTISLNIFNLLFIKAFLVFCYNGSSCSSSLSAYLHNKKSFVESITITYTKVNPEWAIYRTLEPWYNISQYLDELFSYTKHTLSEMNLPVRDVIAQNILSRLETSKILKAVRASTKARYLDDLVVAASLPLVNRRDAWLIEREKPTAGTKLFIKRDSERAKIEKKWDYK